MSQRRAIVNGAYVWLEEGPSAARVPGVRGALIVGAPGPVEQARINSRASAEAARERRKEAVT